MNEENEKPKPDEISSSWNAILLRTIDLSSFISNIFDFDIALTNSSFFVVMLLILHYNNH